jgi:GH15 family glucan-1,4-alpha-glucosidase
MAYQPIENYGIVGNMRTVALIGIHGSIDWFCYPHFDSPSIFGALLDDRSGGRFSIRPRCEGGRNKQFYWPSTNILVTRFLSSDGVAEIEDFMPVGRDPDSQCLLRRVKCVRGSMAFSLECTPAFEYGRQKHIAEKASHGVAFRTERLSMVLCTDLPFGIDGSGGVHAEFVLNEGQSRSFVFKPLSADAGKAPPSEKEAQDLFEATVYFWRNWLSSCTYRGRWREQVYRSALALKLLTFEPTGAVIAAPTTSIPEVIGGVRNWDYRYTWMRDAALTIYALLRIGFSKEAMDFMNWLKNFAPDENPEKPIPIMFSVRGEKILEEKILGHWEGYRSSRPVRIGNGAYQQFQVDIYGELMDAIYLFNKYVAPVSYDLWEKIRVRANWVCENWRVPDDGIWEMRNKREHFVYSKIMNWVALDRAIRLADKRSFPADTDKWRHVRDQIYEEVMDRGWRDDRGAFTQAYGRTELDASVLIMPLVFFMAPNDPRMLSTIDAIMKPPVRGGLFTDGLVYRYPPGPGSDGLPGEEGTFNVCSFWLVEALTRAGSTNPDRLDQARLLFERMLGFANHLGLYAEQTGSQGEALGNFPQALTHLALISAAFNLDRTLGNRP